MKKILTICHFGENRSKYLASILKNKNYDVKYKGVKSKTNQLTQKDVDWADKIIIVRDVLKEMFLKKFDPKKKEIITLDIIDNPESIRGKSDFVWNKYQEKNVYPEIEKQIKKYLPL